MPTQPSPWYPGPLSPQQLNLALYSYNGSGYGATGVLFHSHRLIMAESMTQCRAMTVSSAGTWNIFQGTNTTAFNIVDTACLFGLGAEYPGVHAVYHFVPQALGANGVAGTNSAATGGNYLVAHFATGAAAGATPAAIGAGMYVQPGTLPSVFSAQGVVQAQGTGHAGMTMYLDLVNTGTNANTWQPAGFYADASLTTETPAASSTDTAGFTPRDLWVWASVTTGGSTVSQVPTPQVSWSGALTSTLMNGPSGPVQALTLLNNPPALRVSQALTTSISSGTATPVPFTVAGTIDTYSAFNSSSSTYVVPLNGLYLVFPTIAFASNATGARYAGIQVLTGGTGSSISSTFTAAGTTSWTAPPGVTSVQVQCWGAGGGGGGGTALSGGGGGGGEYAAQTLSVTPGLSYSLVVGAGGTGGTAATNGAAGGISTFTGDSAVTITAHGGGGGAGTALTGTNPGGAGGTGSGASTAYAGGAGAAGTATTSGGGGSSAGTGSAGNAATGTSGASAPTGGGAGGSGGSGGGGGIIGTQPGGGGGGSST